MKITLFFDYFVKKITLLDKYFCKRFSSNLNPTKIECKIYKINDNFIYPEQELEYIKDKENIGIVLPVGGLRACVYSYGILRGLHHLNILQKTRYMVSVSGSSWLTSIFCYQKLCSNCEFLGKYIPPEELTLKKLQTVENENEFTNVLYNINGYDDLFKNLINDNFSTNDNKNIIDVWSSILSDIMYSKYNLNDFTTVHSLSLLNKECPFIIIKGCVSYCNKILSIEFTPEYYGIPEDDPTIKASGIYTEPKGYIYLDSINDNKLIINDNCDVLSIMKTASISSNLIPCAMPINDIIYNYLDLPYMKCYNQEMQLIDGGADGEQGLLSLIKRNIKTIIFVCPVESTDDTTITLTELVEKNISLSKYFGYPNNENEIQVFIKEDWYTLLEQFKNLIQNNKPLVVKLNLNTIPNNKYRIKGGDNIDVIFIHPSQNEWLTTHLPPETKQYIKNNQCISKKKISSSNFSNNNFTNYPYTNFVHINYSIELVTAMSQNAAYDIISNKNIFT